MLKRSDSGANTTFVDTALIDLDQKFQTVPNHYRLAESPDYYYLFTQHPELHVSRRECFPGNNLKLSHKKSTTTVNGGEQIVRERIQVERLNITNLKDLFKSLGFNFESEHLSFDRFLKQSNSVRAHLSIRYENNLDQHVVVRVDFDYIDGMFLPKNAVSFKQYESGEFHLATECIFTKTEKKAKANNKKSKNLKKSEQASNVFSANREEMEARVLGYVNANYIEFLTELVLDRTQCLQALKHSYTRLEKEVSMLFLGKNSEAIESDEILENKLEKGGVLLKLISQINMMGEPSDVINNDYIVRKMVEYKQQIKSKSVSDSKQDDEERDDYVLVSSEIENEDDVEYVRVQVPSEAQYLLAEIGKVTECLEQAGRDVIDNNKSEGFGRLVKYTDELEILLILLELTDHAGIEQALLDERQEKLAGTRSKLEWMRRVLNRHAVIKTQLEGSELSPSAQYRIAYTRARAEQDIEKCESDSLIETNNNKLLLLRLCIQVVKVMPSEQSLRQEELYQTAMQLIKEYDLLTVLLEVGRLLCSPEIGDEYASDQRLLSPIIFECNRLEEREYYSLGSSMELQAELKQFVLFIKNNSSKKPINRLGLNNCLMTLNNRLRESVTDQEGFEKVQTMKAMLEKLVSAKLEPGQNFLPKENCLAYLWVFNLIPTFLIGPVEYVQLAGVFSAMQYHQGDIKPTNYFRLFNQDFVSKLTRNHELECVKNSKEYKSLSNIVREQLRAEVATEKSITAVNKFKNCDRSKSSEDGFFGAFKKAAASSGVQSGMKKGAAVKDAKI